MYYTLLLMYYTLNLLYFLKIADVFNLVKSTILFIFKCCGVLTSASDKDKLFCLNIF